MDKVVYGGRSYFRYPEKGKPYYYGGGEFLHRKVWMDNNGAIPKDHYVHHRDGVKTNNKIENLELVHQKKHGIDHYNSREPIEKKCDCCADTFKTKTRRKADRFCSNKCKSKWRRDNKVDHIEKNCTHCGVAFFSNKYDKGIYCSKSCGLHSRWAGVA